MKIILSHESLSAFEVEGEMETEPPETITAIAQSLGRLGHDVELLGISDFAWRDVAAFEGRGADLVLNLARGRNGRAREAFWPSLFERLGLAYTGSGAFTSTLALDRHATRFWLKGHGIPVARSVFVESPRQLTQIDLPFPLRLRPNFESTATGPRRGVRVERPEELRLRAEQLLTAHPDGILLEEAAEGLEILIPFLERGGSDAEYLLPAVVALEQPTSGAGSIPSMPTFVPARLERAAQQLLSRLARSVMTRLDIRDFGCLCFRLRPDGAAVFLEASTLPSLGEGAPLRVSVEAGGLGDLDGIIDAITKSAAQRQGLAPRATRRRSGLKVGLSFNLKRIKPHAGGESDTEAEYDSPQTIQAIDDALLSLGHEVIRLEATPELPGLMASVPVDVVFNLAEGLRGRNREALAPALFELLDIPYTGSDPTAMCLALDKGLAKQIVAQAGVPTPPYFLMSTGQETLPASFPFPAIVKPLAEGSSKGVFPSSVVENEAELRRVAREIADRYAQPALVEAYLDGREFTVALLGADEPRLLPPMEVVFLNPENTRPVYAFDHKLDWSAELRYDAPAQIDSRLASELEWVARTVFRVLGCRDVARIDVRLDRQDRVNFLDCNPLPGLSPGWSDLCLIAESAGMDYRTLIGEILAPAIARLRAQQSRTNGN